VDGREQADFPFLIWSDCLAQYLRRVPAAGLRGGDYMAKWSERPLSKE
jgi:hypothetical protein